MIDFITCPCLRVYVPQIHLDSSSQFFEFSVIPLTIVTIESAARALESKDNVHGGHGLSPGVLCVGHSVFDDSFEEDLDDRAGFFVDETRDALHTTATSKTTDRRLGNTLDIVPANFAVTLCTALSKAFGSLATSTGAASTVLIMS